MFTGLAGIYAAALDESGSTPQYTEGFQVGAGMAVQIVPQYAEGSAYGDNRRVKYKKKFKNANVTLGTTSLPKVAEKVMFGRTVEEGKPIISSSKDTSKFVGLGLYATEEAEDDAETLYTAVWLHKVKFEDPGDDFETEGENITFKTPSLAGSAETLKNGNWREKQSFKTEAEAIAWIKEKAGISTAAAQQGDPTSGTD